MESIENIDLLSHECDITLDPLLNEAMELLDTSEEAYDPFLFMIVPLRLQLSSMKFLEQEPTEK